MRDPVVELETRQQPNLNYANRNTTVNELPTYTPMLPEYKTYEGYQSEQLQDMDVGNSMQQD